MYENNQDKKQQHSLMKRKANQNLGNGIVTVYIFTEAEEPCELWGGGGA